MACFTDRSAQGEFYTRDTRKIFEYRNTACQWALDHGLLSEISLTNGEIRYANILKTVAYVAIDEDANGMPVLDRWLIVKMWSHDAAKQ